MANPKSDNRLVDALMKRMGTNLAPGEHTGRLDAGDLTLDVVITVRRTVSGGDWTAYRAEAMKLLEQAPQRATCEIYSKKRGGFSKYTSRCDHTAGHVVIHRRYDGEKSSRFVCGVHREHHGIAPADLLAVVDLRKDEVHRIAVAHARKREADSQARYRTERGAESFVEAIGALAQHHTPVDELAQRRAKGVA